MDINQANPLAKHFRRPVIYIKLPSNGRYWEDGTLELPVNNEIPVYPMTTADEITLKTPDALLNGSAVVNVIQSCCPNIKNAWKMPSVDVDITLIALRIASYGQHMTIEAKCPHCGDEHDYDVDLSGLISGVTCPNYSIPVDYNGLNIKLKPQQYAGITKTNITQFEEEKIAQALRDPLIDEDVRSTRMAQSMKTIMDLTEQLLVDSTEYIETEDGTKVTQPEYIKEFYKNSESRVTKLIEDRLAEIAKEGALPMFKLNCSSCNSEYSVPLEFDYSRFFAQGS